MESLPVIPTPPAQRWREIRIRYLPPVLFFCVAVAIFCIWREHVLPPTLLGQVQAVRAEVISPDDGVVTNIFVTEFQKVRAGEVIAEVISSDSKRIDTQLNLLRNQISLSQLQIGTLMDRQNMVFSYLTLRSRVLREGIELSAAKAQLDAAEKDYLLANKLFEEKVLSQLELDYYAKVYGPLKSKVEQTTVFMEEMSRELDKMKPLASFALTTSSQNVLDDAFKDLNQERQTLQSLQLEPVALRSPIDGIVQTIHRRKGENILAGASIVTIAATQGDRIIGYMREPMPFTPTEGMKVRIRTQTIARHQDEGLIAAIGGQFEAITNVALALPNVPPQLGLPIAVSIPAKIKGVIRPGEVVELTIQR
jgi:multidrug resistance efflux pump